MKEKLFKEGKSANMNNDCIMNNDYLRSEKMKIINMIPRNDRKIQNINTNKVNKDQNINPYEDCLNDSFGFKPHLNSANYENKLFDNKLEELLRKLDLNDLLKIFLENKINFNDLVLLTKDDLIELNIKLGPRNRLLKFIEDYKHLGLTALDRITETFVNDKLSTPGFKIKDSSSSKFHNEISLNSDKNYDTNNTNENIQIEDTARTRHRKVTSMIDQIKIKLPNQDDSFDQGKRMIDNSMASKNSNKLEKTFEGLNNDIQNFMKNYKHQKEKSNKLKRFVEIPKTNNLKLKQYERKNNSNYDSSQLSIDIKEEGTRNLKDELSKSSSISNKMKNNENNSSKYSTNNTNKFENTNSKIVFNHVNSAKNLNQSRLLKDINEKKKLIQENLSKCNNSIDEKRRMLRLLQDENFYNSETFHQMLQINEGCKANKSLLNNIRADGLIDEPESLNQTIYVKKKLPKTKSFKKYL